jgi:hypothetical protein
MGTPVRYRMHFNPTGELRAAAWECEASVFYDEYHNTTEEWRDEYEPYESASFFTSITDLDGRTIAASRIIQYGPAGNKTLVDISHKPWEVDGVRSAHSVGMDIENCWDVATLAVRKGAARSGYLTLALLHGMIQASFVSQIDWMTMILDARARRLLHAIGLPNSILPGTRPASYAGLSGATPAWANVSVMLDNQRRMNPEGYRLVAQGIGLDDMELPSSFDLTATPEPVPVRTTSGVLEVA